MLHAWSGCALGTLHLKVAIDLKLHMPNKPLLLLAFDLL